MDITGQPDSNLTQFIAGNAGAMASAKLAPAPAEKVAAGGPPLQIIVGKQKMPELYAYIRGLTPDDLSAKLEAFDQGMLRTVVPMWRKMCHRDGHLLSVSEKRLGRIAALEWKVLPVDDAPAAQAQAEYLRDFIEGIPEFASRLETLSEAIKYRVAGCEIEWLPGGGKDGKLGCRLWPVNPEDLDLAAGRTRLYLGNAGVVEMPADKFVVHLLPVALMEASSILYVMKLITAGQWLAFGEKFGMPGILGTAPASASQDDVDKFYQMLCNWGQEFVAAFREGYSVTTLPAGGANGTLTYPQMIEWADNENSKIWTGHTVTTEASSGSGTLAGNGAQVQLDDLVVADGMRLARTIERALCEPAIRFQFGQKLLVRFALESAKPMTTEERKSEAETDATLVNEVGLALVKTELYNKYGHRQPGADEEVVTGKPEPTTPGLPATPTADAPSPVGPPIETPAGKDLQTSQDTVLNGAQITAATAIVKSVSAGEIPLDAGLGQLQLLFNLSPKQAQMMMGSAGTKTPTQANPILGEPAADKPAPPTPPAPTAFKTDSPQSHRDTEVAREAIGSAMKPLEELLARAGGMSPDDFRSALVRLDLPIKDFAAVMQDQLIAAFSAGAAAAKTKAGGGA